MIVHFYDQLNDSINKHFWNFHEMTTFLKTLGEFRSWNLMNFQNGYFKMDFACTINSYAQGSKVSLNSFFGISNCSRILCRIFGLYEEVDFKFNSWKNLKFYIFEKLYCHKDTIVILKVFSISKYFQLKLFWKSFSI